VLFAVAEFLVFFCLSISAFNCLEKLVSEMTYYLSSGTSNSAHFLISAGSFFLARCCVGVQLWARFLFSEFGEINT